MILPPFMHVYQKGLLLTMIPIVISCTLDDYLFLVISLSLSDLSVELTDCVSYRD